MKILEVVPYFYPALSYGGPAKVVYQLSLALTKDNEVEVFTTDTYDSSRRITFSDRRKIDGRVKVSYFRNISNSLAFKYKLFCAPFMILKYIHRKNEFDIVHYHDFFAIHQMIMITCSIILQKPYVISPHGTLDPVRLRQRSLAKSLLLRVVGRYILGKSKAIIATSDSEKNDLKKFTSKKAVIVENGYKKPDVFPKTTAKLKKYHDPDLFTLLYIGRIHKLKGLDTLLEALARLNREKFQLLIVGPDDGHKSHLEKIKDKDEIKNIHFLGPVTDEAEKAYLYSISDTFIYPSKSEGFSISILEALAAGLPVIISTACHFSKVDDYGAGSIFKVGDSKELLEILRYYIKRPKMIQKKTGRARKLVDEKYSIGRMKNEVISVYRSVLESERKNNG